MYPRFLLDELKNAVDVEELLYSLGVKNIVANDKEIRCTCPIHKGDGNNFSFDLEKEIWTCFSRGCGEGMPRDVFALVQLVENENFGGAIKKIAEITNINLDNITLDKDKYDSYEIKKWINHKKKLEKKPTRIIDEEFLKKYKSKTHPYITQRVSQDAIDFWELGYADEGEFKGRVVVPIRDVYGNLVGFSGRATDNKSIAKYKHMMDFSKGVHLYGLYYAKDYISIIDTPTKDSLVLVEGFFDVIRAWEYLGGVSNVVATMGTSLLPEQIKLVMQYATSVVLAFDPDESGRKATQRVANQLQDVCSLYELEMKKDFGSMSQEEFWNAFTNPKKYSA